MPAAARTRTSRSTAASLIGNPPRPPNAWIIYRSEKMKLFPPPAPGEPPRPQADVSKAISAMWKAEPPETRALYERASEIKKAEHAAKYPNYRFQPLKKEDKERIREERKAEKEQSKLAKQTARKSRSLATTSLATPIAASPRDQVASGSTSYRWKPASGHLDPYFNPADPLQPPSTSSSLNQLPTQGIASPQTVLSQSTSSSGSDSLENNSASTSSSIHTPYPPSPEHCNFLPLAAPVPSHTIPEPSEWPDNLGDMVRQALADYAPSSTLQNGGDTSQDFLLNLDPSAMQDSSSWIQLMQSQPGVSFTCPPNSSPTFTVSDDPNSFDLGGLDPYLDDPTHLNSTTFYNIPANEEYTNFLVSYDTSNTFSPLRPYDLHDPLTTSSSSHPSFTLPDHPCPAEEAAPPSQEDDLSLITPSSSTSSHPSSSTSQPSFTQPYSPPKGATNTAVRRVGGDWRRTFPTPRVSS